MQSRLRTRAVIVHRLSQGEKSYPEELKSLAEAAGYIIVGSIEQTRSADSSYQIGKGKASELANLVKELDVTKIIFNNALKPIQAYNLAKITGVEAIDRFQLILEIFAKRTTTREAQLQVQLASLRYQFPRAKESVKLARMGEQPGFLGLGRYEVDVYLEAMKRQISHIRKELRTFGRKRGLQRTRRVESGFFLVSLAGYTYSGKTTLFNKLASTFKPVDQGLFTTLSTTTRAVDFQDRNVLLTDTVGFVDHLPLFMIEAFHSTLEETVLSDVIILVIDFHETIEEVSRKLMCCMDTLNEIGAYGVPVVTVLNKIDLMPPKEIDEKFSLLGKLVKNPITISAFLGLNLEEVKQRVIELLASYLQVSFSLPLNNEVSSFISGLYSQVNVLHVDYRGEEIRFTLRATPWILEKINGQIGKLGGKLVETQYEKKPL